MKLEIKVGPEVGTKLINDLIKKCVCDEGYRSEAALARALGIVPQKLNRWKKGKSRVSSEMVTLIGVLMHFESFEDIKKTLGRSLIYQLRAVIN